MDDDCDYLKLASLIIIEVSNSNSNSKVTKINNLSYITKMNRLLVPSYFKSKLYHKEERIKRQKSPFPLNIYCRSCFTKSTPEWRRGPDGYKSLCNACGLRYSAHLRKEKLIKSNPPRKIPITNLLN
eukprot:TRINITY_DN13046_c0_g1_i1.p1 TRINITY_DN13046_c0_g1~~TRINITY_DN13046_c0_g1_i1.p1  ORF type:complete len:127 (+),score=3.71 TRINITY_DN13046_c0_g1_i1:93-473(+)